jgi:hypothetical protein
VGIALSSAISIEKYATVILDGARLIQTSITSVSGAFNARQTIVIRPRTSDRSATKGDKTEYVVPARPWISPTAQIERKLADADNHRKFSAWAPDVDGIVPHETSWNDLRLPASALQFGWQGDGRVGPPIGRREIERGREPSRDGDRALAGELACKGDNVPRPRSRGGQPPVAAARE